MDRRRSLRRRSFPTGTSVTCAAWCRACVLPSGASRIGLCLAVVLLYLILVAQFRSFIDPFLILLAVPLGLTGVIGRAAG